MKGMKDTMQRLGITQLLSPCAHIMSKLEKMKRAKNGGSGNIVDRRSFPKKD
jgi:hypothetical protein